MPTRQLRDRHRQISDPQHELSGQPVSRGHAARLPLSSIEARLGAATRRCNALGWQSQGAPRRAARALSPAARRMA
eukprot:4840068-Prymnesium_polylepis.1